MLSKAVANKFEKHFWYLTEQLVVLALFSSASVQENPFTQLKDLFGPESWVFFKLINKTPVFLSKSASNEYESTITQSPSQKQFLNEVI